MLVFGDSYTADKNNYVHLLRDSLPKSEFNNFVIQTVRFCKLDIQILILKMDLLAHSISLHGTTIIKYKI